jgi:hypothetical protein
MTYPTILPRSARVLEEVSHERARQDARWGQQNHPDGTGPRGVWFLQLEAHLAGDSWLNGDVADAAKHRCASAADVAEGDTWEKVLTEEVAEAYAESDVAKLRTELIQVAAVAVAWVEAIDRRAQS